MSDERLPELYEEAADLDEPGRRAFLDRLRAAEPALADELAELFAAPEEDPSPIDGSSLAAAGIEPGGPPPPRRVGPYRILRELGRGGMGRVFLAEQETPDFRRTVALKLIDRPGPDEEAVRRFRAEVRILAALDHPGIVRFLDGGRSPEGSWFIALEVVEGDDLLAHARRESLGVADRVRLFLGVAEAVAFAHARGVVHRDLKPANVLVGRDGRPRLLDFGISKLLGAATVPDPTQTRADRRPLTPAYASPEQLAGEPATAASDVYSLGVVLYELLAGRRPTGSTGRAGGGRVDRNLDAICLKALQRDPADRYPSAAELAADLRRRLEGRRAAARGLGRSRRLAPLAALGALLLLGSIVWLARPRTESGGPEPAAAAPQPARPGGFPFDPLNPPPVEETERRFEAAPEDVVAGAALALGLDKAGRTSEATIVIGRLRQIPGEESNPLIDFAEGRIANNRGEEHRALIFYTRARDRALAQGRADLVGTIRSMRGRILAQLGQRDAAVEELERARADCRRSGDDVALYRTLNDLALEVLQRGGLERGEAMLESAVAAGHRAGFEPLVALRNLAEVKLLRGRPDAAEPLARDVIELRRDGEGRLAGARAGAALALLAAVVRDLGRAEEAAALLDDAIALQRDAGGENLADALHDRALEDLGAGRLDRLPALIAELEAAAQAGLRRRPLGYAHSVRARAAAVRGELDRARRDFAEARRLLRSEGDHDLAALTDLAWAEAEAAAGSRDEALRILDEALAELDQAAATEAGWFAGALRARLDAAAGRTDAARERLAGLGDDMARSPSLSRRLAFLRARARLAAAAGRPEDARADLEAAIAAAGPAQRKLAELELRLDLAVLAGDAETAARLASEVEREASRLGLAGLAGRARAARIAG